MLKKIGVAFFFRGIGAISTLIMTIVIAKTFSAEDAGYFFLGFTLLSILVPINLFGNDIATLRFIGASHAYNDWASIHGYAIIAIIITIITSFMSSIAIFFLADILSNNIWKKPGMLSITKGIAFVSFFFSISTLLAFYLQAINRIVESITVLSIFTPLGISFCILVYRIENIEEVILFLITISIINVIIGLILISKSIVIRQPFLPKIKSFLAVCFPLWITALMLTLLQWGSLLIAAAWVSPEEIAYLSASQRTANLVSFILVAVNLIMAPKFAALYQQGRNKELKDLALHSVKILTFISLPIVAILITFSNIIMSLFGEEFSKNNHLLIILAIGQLFNTITGSVGYLLTMSGHEKDMRNIVLLTAPITMLLTLTITPSLGVSGAAIATAFGVIIQNLSAVYLVKKRLGFNTILFWKA